VPDLFVADLAEAASMILGNRRPPADFTADLTAHPGLAYLGERA
jgi:hypothetical protein